jgi:hypothetical protein
VLISQLPRESRLVRLIDPRSMWGPTDYLLASAVDALHGANWQRAKGKGRKPTPLPRPGATPRDKRIGTASMPIDEWNRRYAARFPERGVKHGRRARTGVRLHHPVGEGDREDTQP